MIPVEVILQVIGGAGAIALTAALGFVAGTRKFRKDESFTRRLDWHESTVRRLEKAARKLRETIGIMNDPVLTDGRDAAWESADEALDGIRGLDVEAELYTSDAAYNALRDAIRHASEEMARGFDVFRIVPGRSQPTKEEQQDALAALRLASTALIHAASRIATDIRKDLSLSPVRRPIRLYDDVVTGRLKKGSVATLAARVSAMNDLKKVDSDRGLE